jgi:hypothetical protein
MLALILKSPAMAITDDEAKRLALALKNLAQFYSITPNPQVMAWIQLLTVAASIYGPKLMILAAQQRAAKAAASNPVKAAGGTPVPSPAPMAPGAATPTGVMNWGGANPSPISPTPQGVMKFN